jgi:hypothetical protein
MIRGDEVDKMDEWLKIGWRKAMICGGVWWMQTWKTKRNLKSGAAGRICTSAAGRVIWGCVQKLAPRRSGLGVDRLHGKSVAKKYDQRQPGN